MMKGAPRHAISFNIAGLITVFEESEGFEESFNVM
jgi:hypothetical protein